MLFFQLIDIFYFSYKFWPITAMNKNRFKLIAIVSAICTQNSFSHHSPSREARS